MQFANEIPGKVAQHLRARKRAEMPCVRVDLKQPQISASIREVKTRRESVGEDETPTLLFTDTDRVEKGKRFVTNEVSALFCDESEIKANDSEAEAKLETNWPSEQTFDDPIVSVWHNGTSFGFKTKEGQINLPMAENAEGIDLSLKDIRMVNVCTNDDTLVGLQFATADGKTHCLPQALQQSYTGTRIDLSKKEKLIGFRATDLSPGHYSNFSFIVGSKNNNLPLAQLEKSVQQ